MHKKARVTGKSGKCRILRLNTKVVFFHGEGFFMYKWNGGRGSILQQILPKLCNIVWKVLTLHVYDLNTSLYTNNSIPRRNKFQFWILVPLILEVWRHKKCIDRTSQEFHYQVCWVLNDMVISLYVYIYCLLFYHIGSGWRIYLAIIWLNRHQTILGVYVNKVGKSSVVWRYTLQSIGPSRIALNYLWNWLYQRKTFIRSLCYLSELLSLVTCKQRADHSTPMMWFDFIRWRFHFIRKLFHYSN